MHRLTFRLHHVTLWAYALMPIAVAFMLTSSVSYGLELGQRSIAIANNAPSITTNYSVSLTTVANETLGSVEIQFCSNNPIIYLNCTPPNGFSDTNSQLVSQYGVSGFSVDTNLSNQNTIILTRNPSIINATTIGFSFANIVNPSSSGEFFGRLQTFATSDTSGLPTDTGGVAMDIQNPYSITVTVPPYLLFCVGVSIPNLDCSQSQGNIINFGDLSPNYTAKAQSQLLVATNAQYGYAIQVAGNTMTSGNNILPSLTAGSIAAPGTSQFGFNLVANNSPNVGSNPSGPGSGWATNGYSQPNIFKFVNGDVIAESSNVSSYREYTVSYILNMSKNQPPGVYSTTLSFIGMAYF